VAAACAGLIVVVSGAARAQQPITIAGVTAAPGTLANGRIAITAPDRQAASEIPFSIVQGAKPGPVLLLVAGTHGMEYAPILALQRLRASIDPARVSGTVVMVHVANMPSFLGRTIYYSPADGKNLNRVFPGKPDGTVSERIAHAITTELIARATHVIDLHCGDGNESLRPYTYWITTGAPEVAEAGRQMALAFGLDHIVIDRERPADPDASVYLSNTAVTRGKPALTTEAGALGQTDEASIDRILHGIAGVMRHLAMTADGPAPAAHPIWIDRSEVLRAGFTGILQAFVERGHTVAAGAPIARITDWHGRVLEEIRAPFDGEVLYMVATPPVSKGEPVGFIGARK
jgi:predicted deacylase